MRLLLSKPPPLLLTFNTSGDANELDGSASPPEGSTALLGSRAAGCLWAASANLACSDRTCATSTARRKTSTVWTRYQLRREEYRSNPAMARRRGGLGLVLSTVPAS